MKFAQSLLSASLLCLGMVGYAQATPKRIDTTRTAKAAQKLVEVHEANAEYEFSFSYPAQFNQHPALKSWLEKERTSLHSRLAQSVKKAVAASKDNGDDMMVLPWSEGSAWQIEAEAGQWISIRENRTSFLGGAHPNHSGLAHLWDTKAGKFVKPTDLFTSPKALSQAVQEDFCALLDKERSERRGEVVVRNPNDSFTACLIPTNFGLSYRSTQGKGFDQLVFTVNPYEAGPYAEGGYEIVLPITPKVLKLVRPESRSAFGG